MHPTLQVFITGAAIAIALMVILWIISLIIRNSSIVDMFWGAGFVILAWSYAAAAGKLTTLLPRHILTLALVTIWGLRLATHISIRNWRKAEDFRYQAWRAEHPGSWWIVSLFQVFVLQGLIMLAVSTPLLIVLVSDSPAQLTLLDVLAAMGWSIGFFFEAVGDAHLVRFKRDEAGSGKLLTSGVWSYSRHPNYFGDALQWWAFYLLAVSPGGWWTIFSPILMAGLLVKVSGVAMLEKTLKNTKPGYEDYVSSTNAFLPGLPRKKRKS